MLLKGLITFLDGKISFVDIFLVPAQSSFIIQKIEKTVMANFQPSLNSFGKGYVDVMT